MSRAELSVFPAIIIHLAVLINLVPTNGCLFMLSYKNEQTFGTAWSLTLGTPFAFVMPWCIRVLEG
ncbi:hypothetical protein K461DRAFT_273785 [Myriangium duriaei CBS 260.36]|uniref:Uncharacterized protein n=1 Tax=Myriangium duriaei CBS 260.36 TaxID=1168546 RepID=A0A9P4MJX1_9PEZI|nr:hypothetical protein K461DRAFT_273785 [Myriangium duriaei CBS 260.36]